MVQISTNELVPWVAVGGLAVTLATLKIQTHRSLPKSKKPPRPKLPPQIEKKLRNDVEQTERRIMGSYETEPSEPPDKTSKKAQQ